MSLSAPNERESARGTQTASTRLWLVPLLLFLGVAVVYGLTVRHSDWSWDTYTANFASWHLVHNGSPWIDGVDVHGLSGTSQAYVWIKESADGHTVVARFPGVVAISVPAYFIARPDHMTVVPAAITVAVTSALSIMLMFLALRRYVGTTHVVVASCALAFATPIWSISADATWPHTVTVLGIAGMAYGAATERWWLVGLFGGVTLWGRLHAALVVAFVGVLLAIHRRNPRLLLAVGGVSAVFLALLCLWTHWMYGSWNPTASYGGGVFDVRPTGALQVGNQLGMWIAPDRGILVWTPALLFLAPTVKGNWRHLPDWARYLLVGGFLYTVVQAWLIVFTGGDHFYGYRLGLEFLVCATPAYVIAMRRPDPLARALMPSILTLQLCAFAVGAVFENQLLPEDRAWTDNSFLLAMRDFWPVGPSLVATMLVIVILMQVRRHRARAGDQRQGPETLLEATSSTRV